VEAGDDNRGFVEGDGGFGELGEVGLKGSRERERVYAYNSSKSNYSLSEKENK